MLPLIPPAVTDGFSVERAMVDIEQFATEPHPIGSQVIESVRSGIVARLAELGLEAQLQPVEAIDYFGSPGNTVSVVNVMARIPGSASTGAVALVGHYDTVPTTPGANDNTAAVAVLLETARLVLAGPTLRNDVVLVFTDGEEPAPRFGSTAFVEEHPWAADIEVVVNLEAIGGGGPSHLLTTVGPRGWLTEEYVAATPTPTVYSFLLDVVDAIGGSNTDIAPFRDRGIAGVELAFLHGSSIYHTPADVPGSVGARSLHHQGLNAVSAVRRFADLDLSGDRSSPDEVFVTVGRGSVWSYPASWSVPLLLGAGGLLVGSWWRRRAGRRLLRSVGVTAVVVFVSAVVAVAVWWPLSSVRSTPGMAEGYVYLFGLVALASGVSVFVHRGARRRWGVGLDPLAVTVVWWVLAAATVVIPGVASLFVWPALVTAAALAVNRGRGWVRLAGFGLVTATTLLLVVPAIDVFFQFAQPRPGNPDSEMLWMIAVPVFLVALVVELVRAVWPDEVG